MPLDQRLEVPEVGKTKPSNTHLQPGLSASEKFHRGVFSRHADMSQIILNGTMSLNNFKLAPESFWL
jgi:hypothetical protein